MKRKSLKLKTPDTEMVRRMWLANGVVLALMLIGAAFVSWPTMLSVAVGGAIALINFRLLQNNINKVLRPARLKQALGATLTKYYIRFAATAVVLIILMWARLVEPLGLLAGLSVVVISTFVWALSQALSSLTKEAM